MDLSWDDDNFILPKPGKPQSETKVKTEKKFNIIHYTPKITFINDKVQNQKAVEEFDYNLLKELFNKAR